MKRKQKQKRKRVQYTSHMDPDVLFTIKLLAVDRDVDYADVIEEAVVEYLTRRNIHIQHQNHQNDEGGKQ